MMVICPKCGREHKGDPTFFEEGEMVLCDLCEQDIEDEMDDYAGETDDASDWFWGDEGYPD